MDQTRSSRRMAVAVFISAFLVCHATATTKPPSTAPPTNLDVHSSSVTSTLTSTSISTSTSTSTSAVSSTTSLEDGATLQSESSDVASVISPSSAPSAPESTMESSTSEVTQELLPPVMETSKPEEDLPAEIVKPGHCPSNVMNASLCPDDIEDQCSSDDSCSGEAKCCSTGCARVCILPTFSACEVHRTAAEKRARSMGLQDLSLPECSPLGDFVPVQCDGERCFCVDPSTGREVPGTRAKTISEIDCANPRPCSGYQCRMLCTHGFDLDDEGCPLCKCLDPCKGIECPGGNDCYLEEIHCAKEPCRPVPSCRKARTLESLCPLGEPLMLDQMQKRPFLCGEDPGKPPCPPLYTCKVKEGHDYGVCCADIDKFAKPGQCPVSPTPTDSAGDKPEGDPVECGATCRHDLQCPSTHKCCMSDNCGQHCVQPANLTVCLQQKMIAELLVSKEREGKGYVPQCRDDDGLYETRQCSRNKLVCWCVDDQGNKIPRTMGAAHEVDCQEVQPVATKRISCPADVTCPMLCEYGHVVGTDGCPTCECDDPCQSVTCPQGTNCVMRKEDGCTGVLCDATPMCIAVTTAEDETPETVNILTSPLATSPEMTSPSMSSFTAPFRPPSCPNDAVPLTVGEVVLVCNENDPCPKGYLCTPSPNAKSACCPIPQYIEETKPGQCPFIRPTGECKSRRCTSDRSCDGDLKCCNVPSCGPLCVTPLKEFNDSFADDGLLQGPTMCEYLRDLVELEGVTFAIPTPTCDPEGAYEAVQCNDLGQCWCVDDFGAELPGSKVSSRELVVCDKVRQGMRCDEAMCRLGCDYGFVLDPDTGCPLCQCRDPCQGVECGSGHTCQMVDIPCVDGICPPIPQCLPILPQDGPTPTCLMGEPFVLADSNATLACSPRARALECPQGFACYAEQGAQSGVCCPNPAVKEKSGQCPFLVPSGGSCDLECTDDQDCSGPSKCCSNGCGTQCLQPIIMTACEHQRALLEHRAREAGIPAGRVFLPQCNTEGAFLPNQCHPGTHTCWCVDEQGQEVPGTRVSQPAVPNCQEPLVCPAMNCDLACLHGYRLDTSGCPVCECKDPCEEVTCTSPLEECRIVHVACVDEPCPPLPVCLPRLENPCPTGSPLRLNETLVECGPYGNQCPSSHKCHLSPLGEYALCCPKPRDVCYQKRDPGFCEGSIPRWFFDPETNQCDVFRFGGCGGNLNNFESKEECLKTCPTLSSCERLREKNLRKTEKTKKISFIPKCERSTGAWQPEQCLEELGVCWCVSTDGDQIDGTLTRGAPQCEGNGRSSRMMKFSSKPSNMVCEPGVNVHVCDKTLCENQMCFAHPHATCRVDPCGGCRVEFLDEFNLPVDCSAGLTECQKDLQRALNSRAFAKPVIGHSLHGTIEGEVDIFQNADVYHSSPVDQDVSFKRRGRKLESEDVRDELRVVGDVVLDSKKSFRGERAVRQDPVSDGLTDGSLVDPDDLPRHLSRAFNDNSEASGRRFSDSDDYASSAQHEYEYNIEAVPTDDLIPKPGTCPSPAPDVSLLTCVPRQECMLDTHCKGSKKCCFNGCGAVCLEPEEVPASVQGMTAQAPVCQTDGTYAREQRSGALTWCVDYRGTPLHGTLTRGDIRCGPGGQIIEQVSLGAVCPQGGKQHVCKDECLNALCPTHPDAVCVADPCNNCRVTFYSPSGEKVHCEERCNQPLAMGMCRASFKRYFYNSTSSMCQEFIYGGCQGNDNNFDDLEECQAACQKPVEVCRLPVEAGTCGGGEARWYYNEETFQCEPFLYSGCGGNGNNFRSKEECEVRCPDLVLCPYWSSESMEPKACSRLNTCFDQTCLGYPDAICTVDPCDCTTRFVDSIGMPVTCQIPTEAPKTRLAYTFEEESSGSGPVTIYLEGDPSLTRCELLRKHQLLSRSERYIAQCDEDGSFLPTQCYMEGANVIPKKFGPENYEREAKTSILDEEGPMCWCIDETGRKTQPTLYFTRGERQCEFVAVESVVVTLGFRGQEVGLKHMGKTKEDEIKKQVDQLLHKMRAETMGNKIGVVDLPDLTQVKFTLLGENKIDVAYQLEEKVKSGGLLLTLEEERIPADLRASWFHHQVSEPRWDMTSVMRGGAREVVGEAITAEPPYLAVTVMFTVITAMVICGLIMAAVLYKRHKTGKYPKGPRGSMQSLAFSDTTLDRPARLADTIISPPRKPTVTTIENEYRQASR